MASWRHSICRSISSGTTTPHARWSMVEVSVDAEFHRWRLGFVSAHIWGRAGEAVDEIGNDGSLVVAGAGWHQGEVSALGLLVQSPPGDQFGGAFDAVSFLRPLRPGKGGPAFQQIIVEGVVRAGAVLDAVVLLRV